MGYICHQLPDRSFHWRGSPLPICARCTGFYAAIPFGLAVALILGLYQSAEILIWLVLTLLALVPMAVDGLTQGFGLRSSTNELRLLTGIVAGGIIGADLAVIAFAFGG